ncbi:hypothetical protein Q3G72_022080 [Acer saccharum]|nr:hypothetical protein Q3G72_022080 [Acer saccharum]
MQDYDKKRKARELIEEVCDELAKEIGEDKAKVEALKRESMKLREELEDERKMLQMAEVWCEERVQVKLVDARVALENKYSQMNKLVAELETFLRSSSATPDVKEMREAVTLTDCRLISPEVNAINKDGDRRHSNAYADPNIDIEDDESGWETVSHLEDRGSSCSTDGSAPSIRNRRDSNVSRSGIEWEDNGYEGTPITEISEVCSVLTKPLKKVSSIGRLWRSGPNNGENYKIISAECMKGRFSSGRLSNVSFMSPDRGSGKGDLSPPDLVGQCSLPESGNPHITHGMKGCIEWPQIKEASRLQTMNRKLSAMNKLLMVENDRLQKQVSHLVYENGYMRTQLQSAYATTTDNSCESVVMSCQHQQQQNPTQHSQRDANNLAG